MLVNSMTVVASSSHGLFFVGCKLVDNKKQVVTLSIRVRKKLLV